MSAWLSRAAEAMRTQINLRWPDRDKHSDGWIGDSRHSSRSSDHNPDWAARLPGVVRAIDIDEDLIGPSFADPAIANDLALRIRAAALIDPRIRYIIFERRICSASVKSWEWRPYHGPNPHDQHIHVSFTPAGDSDGRAFVLDLEGLVS